MGIHFFTTSHEEIASSQLHTELPGKEIKELAGKGPRHRQDGDRSEDQAGNTSDSAQPRLLLEKHKSEDRT